MANITNYLNKIKTAVYGKDVRGAIHDAIKQVYDDASVNHDNANMEVKMARGTHNTLNDRLDKSDEIQAQTNAQLSQNNNDLNARMDTFVAVGSTSDNAETVDIRIGVDGLVDTSAGASVRRQFSNLKSDVTDLRESVTPQQTLVWEQGTITNEGILADSTTRIRTELIRIKPGTVINYGVPEDYSGTVASYNSETGAFIKFELAPIKKVVYDEIDVRFILVGKNKTEPIAPSSANLANIFIYELEKTELEVAFQFGDTSCSVPFKYKGILDYHNGVYKPVENRIASDRIYFRKGVQVGVNLDATERFFVSKYGTNSGWIPYNGKYTIPENGYYAINIGKIDDSDMDIRDSVTITSTSSIKDSIDSQSTIIELISGYYISTSDVGKYINTSLSSLDNWSCAVIDCKVGDTFVINGYGGNGGRIWTFIDSNNICLSTAPAYITMSHESITAPYNATKLIVNLREDNDAYVCKGKSLSRIIKEAMNNDNIIRDASIGEYPSNVMAMPTIEYHTYNFPNSTNVTTKYGIHKNGDYFVITYAQNVDGSVADHPNLTPTGMMEVRYKLMKYADGKETEVSYGTLAKVGTPYTDYKGESATLVGGCSYSSSVNNIAYFSSARSDTTRLNGYANYNLTPCCSSVVILGNTVEFGEIKELTLTIDGDKGRFDMARINGDGFYNYYTSNPPHYNGTSYIWFQPYNGGIAYLTSTNGVDWTLYRKITTTYQPDLEVACTSYNSNLIVFAARTNPRTRGITDYDSLYVGLLNISENRVIQYRLNQIKSKPFLAKTGSSILLFYMPDGYNKNDCIRIEVGQSSLLYFTRWFSLYKYGVQYTTIHQDSIATKNFSKMYLVGGNGDIGNGNGSSFMVLSFPTDKPRTMADIPFMVN